MNLSTSLLHKGKRVPMRQPLPDSPYFVFLSRYQKRPITDIWPVALEESLPVVPVPLLYGDADVRLDLQKAFTDVYDATGLDLLVDYASTPDIPIEDADQAQWVGQVLKKARQS